VTDPRPPIASLSAAELEAWLTEHAAPAYRRKQVWGWLARGATSFEAMRDLPKELRVALEEDFRATSLRPIAVSQADDGLTTKTLFELDGGHSVEAVVMRYSDRSTLCISSQAGCPIGCPFCATGQGPFGRNLRAHEIVDQAVDAARLLAAERRRLSHVVFMGMGEPLANYSAVIEAIRRLADPSGLGISPRRVTVSTSGLVPRIDRLAAEDLAFTLAISLHAARDELRDVLVPLNRRHPLAELVAAADRFAGRTGRRVSYEWVLLAGVNDTDRDARELGALLRGRLAHVNLIPYNPVAGTPYREPSGPAVARFAAAVRAEGLGVTLRDTRGREQDAACGQLRARTAAEAGSDQALEALEPLGPPGVMANVVALIREDRESH
jgi:23S rRNA (adenine2503-C2)-methyltransferase